MAKLAVWAGLAMVAWLAVMVAVMLLVLWPLPTGMFLAGFTAATLLWVRVTEARALVVEAVTVRKDVAVETAMDVAFSAQELEQRISGEHPEVVLFDQDAATYWERLG